MTDYQFKPSTLDPQDFQSDSGGGMSSGLAAGAATGNPWVMAGMVGLKSLEAYKKRKELERQERYQAQVSATSRTQNALAQLSNIGKALKL